MYSNARRELASEAVSPATEERRREGAPAALACRRSSGEAGPIAGATGELSSAVSAMGFPGLHVQDLSTSAGSRSYWAWHLIWSIPRPR
jgi:hypothetical protein